MRDQFRIIKPATKTEIENVVNSYFESLASEWTEAYSNWDVMQEELDAEVQDLDGQLI